MFSDCCSLVAIPMLDTSNVEIMRNTFRSCFSLTTIPLLDISNVTEMDNMFQNCYALKSIPMLDTSNADSIYQMFQFCYALNSIHMLDASKETSLTRLFDGCTSLVHVNIKNVKLAYDLGTATLLTKDSLLYLINNEAAESVITIKLASYAYDKWATDPDIVAALANHLNITLAM